MLVGLAVYFKLLPDVDVVGLCLDFHCLLDCYQEP